MWPDEKPGGAPPEQTGLDRLLSSKEADATESLKVSEVVGAPADTKTPESTQEPLKVEGPAPTVAEAAATEPPAETPPVEPKPEPKPAPAEPEKERAPTWRMIRKMQEQMDALQKELRERAAPPAPVVSAEQPADEDPLGVQAAVNTAVAKIQEQNEAALAQERQLRVQQEENTWIAQQETAFRAQHPEYDKGVEFLVETERKEFRRAGGERVAANNLLATSKLNTPEGLRAKAEIDRIADASDISDEEAARRLASDLWVIQRRNLLVQGARAEGRSIAEVAAELYTDRGFKAIETPAAPANGQQQPTPQAKVEQAKRANEVAPSLSEMNTTTQAPPMVIKTRAQLLELAAKDMRAFTAYTLKMEMEDPDWHQKLPP